MNHNGRTMHENWVSTLIMPGRRYFDKELNSKSKWNQLYFAEYQIAFKMHLRTSWMCILATMANRQVAQRYISYYANISSNVIIIIVILNIDWYIKKCLLVWQRATLKLLTVAQQCTQIIYIYVRSVLVVPTTALFNRNIIYLDILLTQLHVACY